MPVELVGNNRLLKYAFVVYSIISHNPSCGWLQTVLALDNYRSLARNLLKAECLWG
jgi:hypothetical protein